MPAKGTSTGNKRNWLQVIATGLNVLGREASNAELEWWLKSASGRDLWERFAQLLPPAGTLRNYFTEARRSTGDIDRPWSVGQTFSGKPNETIPSQALPLVLLVWQRALAGGRTLTVRQAVWVGRLHSLYNIDQLNTPQGMEVWVSTIYLLASMYAAREQISEGEGVANGPDTSDIDAILAFALLHVLDPSRGLNAALAQKAAEKLGLVRQTEQGAYSGNQIDDEIAVELRLLADEMPDGVQAGRIAQLPFWKVVSLMLGLRSLTLAPDWGDLDTPGKRVRAQAVRQAVETDKWPEYVRLTGLEQPMTVPEGSSAHDTA